MFCYSQATARATVTATIINVGDTAKYIIEHKEHNEHETPLTIVKGDTKSHLLSTFESPDEKVLMQHDKVKEIWKFNSLH
jgi:hypothetical protein